MRIPKEAWPVVEEIRRHVPKPVDLPTPELDYPDVKEPCLGWNYENEYDEEGHKCPLGLLPYAQADRPNSELDYDAGCPFSHEEAKVFWLWWDSQKNPQKAVAEVWVDPLSELEEELR